jgi:hypothetical protein
MPPNKFVFQEKIILIACQFSWYALKFSDESNFPFDFVISGASWYKGYFVCF